MSKVFIHDEIRIHQGLREEMIHDESDHLKPNSIYAGWIKGKRLAFRSKTGLFY